MALLCGYCDSNIIKLFSQRPPDPILCYLYQLHQEAQLVLQQLTNKVLKQRQLNLSIDQSHFFNFNRKSCILILLSPVGTLFISHFTPHPLSSLMVFLALF